MEYKILTSVMLETLERYVKDYLNKGWNLHGSPFIDTINSYPRYAQAMFRDVDEDWDIPLETWTND